MNINLKENIFREKPMQRWKKEQRRAVQQYEEGEAVKSIFKQA